MPLTSKQVMESCDCVLFSICFVFSFQVFLQLLCISLMSLIFRYSAQFLLENALYSAGRMLASKIASSARNAAGRIYPSLTERDLNKLQSGVFCFVFVFLLLLLLLLFCFFFFDGAGRA